MTFKTRDISLTEFLEALQIEYLVAELRSKIYQLDKDKTFWKDRVMAGKRKKIEDILERNPEYKSIFNSDSELQRLKKTIYPEWGMPDMHYHDAVQKADLEVRDILNYFTYGKNILVRTGDKETKNAIIVALLENNGKVKWSNYRNIKPENINFAKVKFRGDSKITVVHIANIVRIL